jgi:hypothetical protein
VPIDPGIGTERSARGFQDFFARWGAKANLRSIFNFVVPVALVDRFRGDDEGSLFALTAETPGALSEHPAVFFGAISGVSTRDDVDLEILSFTVGTIATNMPPNALQPASLHIFTPVSPYNPVLNLNPVGTFIPGMFTNKAFTRGSGIAFAGSNPAWPAGAGSLGFMLTNRQASLGTASPDYEALVGFYGTVPVLGAPIRLFAGSGLAFQLYNPGSLTLSLRVSILYRQRPFYL